MEVTAGEEQGNGVQKRLEGVEATVRQKHRWKGDNRNEQTSGKGVFE